MDERVEAAMNRQIQAELASAYLYLSMSAHFASEGLSGFAHWMRQQSEEEKDHAMRFFDHVVDRGGRVALEAIDQPPTKFGTPLEIFEQVLEHEREVTAAIHALYELVAEAKDHASQPLLLGFITEQIEEEKTATELVEQIGLVGAEKAQLLFLDRELAKR